MGTFVSLPDAHAFDLDCDTVQEEMHDCHHCCHHGHAINTFKEEIEILFVPQMVSNYQPESLSHLYYLIKRPPRLA